MRCLRLESLESRALPAANPLAGGGATDVPNTVNDAAGALHTDPSEAVAFEHGVDPAAAAGRGVGGTPRNPAAPSESVAPPTGHQLEWDDGWWMLDFSDGHSSTDSPQPKDSLTQPPCNQVDGWERIWLLHQAVDSSGPSPRCLAFDQALAEIGEQAAENTAGYFYSHAYTMHYSEGGGEKGEGMTIPRSALPPSTQLNGQSAEVNMPDGGTILLGGIKRPADTMEDSGFRVQG